MIDRRILLATVAGFFGLAAFRWLRVSPAKAGEPNKQQATALLTSMAHRLGTESYNRVDDAAPVD